MHHLLINTCKEQDASTMAVRGKRTYPHEGQYIHSINQ